MPSLGASVISVPVAHYIDVILYVLSSELSSLSATATTTYPTVSFISPTTGEKSAPEPKRFADNVAISGVLTPGGGVLSFHLAITSPATPPTFQCIICGEKGALKMEGKSPAVQLTPPTLYFAEAPEGGEQKGTYDSREGGAEWREVEVPKSGMAGLFGGVAEVYEAIAAGKGVAEGIVDFDEAVKRHRMVEAVERSAIEGRRESYL